MEGKIDFKSIEINKYNSKPRIFLMKKLSSSTKHKNLIKSEIKQFLNEPEKFLSPESRIFINRKINLKKIIPIENIKPIINKTFGLRESRTSKNNKSKLSKLSTIKERNNSNNKSPLEEKEEDITKRNFELIDKEKLKSIFISFQKASNKIQRNKEPEKNNNKEKNDEDNKNLPKQLSIDLSIQNRCLLTKKNIDKQTRETSKYLSRKLRKSESELLFNCVHLYRYKKEILGKEESKDNYNKVNNQSCLFKWTSSLRRPKNFLGKRESYINVGGDNNPLWSIIVEKYPISKEVSVQSGFSLDNKDFRDFLKKRNNDEKSNEKIKKVENLDGISIKGKNLYELEYRREMSGNKNKILHKVLVDNGKAILYKDVNDIFGHQTIYKNYNERNLYRKIKKVFSHDNYNSSVVNKMSLKHHLSSGNIFK